MSNFFFLPPQKHQCHQASPMQHVGEERGTIPADAILDARATNSWR